MYTGPNIIESGLVFGYDADDRSSRFYKGEPTTNLSTTSEAFVNGTNANTNGTWQYSSGVIDNSSVNPNNSLFSNAYQLTLHASTGGAWDVYRQFTGYTAGDIYTVSLYVKLGTATNFCIVVNNTLAWNTIQGKAFTTANGLNTEIWTRVWITFAIPATGKVNVHLGGHNETAVTTQTAGTVFITGVQFEKKSHPTPYLRNTSTSTSITRSTTSGLIDLKKTTPIDLSNVSFDWKGNPYFYAGGGNNISIPHSSTISPSTEVSVELWYTRYTPITEISVVANKYSGFGWEIIESATNRIGICGRNGDGTYYTAYTPNNTIIPGKVHHIVGVREGLYWKTYVDGTLITSTSTPTVGTLYNTHNLEIGMENSSYYTKSKVHSLRVYNRGLTTSEVLQNYNASKGRFEEENRLNEGLVLHLDANNKNSYAGSGTTWYDLAESNNGTLTNGVTFNNSPDSLVFDGVNDFVEIPYTSTLAPVNQITFSAWFYRTNWNDNVNGRILSKTEGGGYQLTSSEGSFVLLGYTGAIIRLNTLGTYASVKVQSSTLSSGYHHILTTFDGRYIKLYIDGVLRDTYDRGTTDTILYVSNNSLILGAEAQSGTGAAGQYMSGKMSKLKIWNRALSLQEVDQDFNNNRGRFNL